MECCDSVSADVSYINQPSGICSSTASRVLLLPRERTSFLSSASPSNQGNPGESKIVEGEGVEKRTFDDGYGKEIQINDCDGDDFVKPQKECDKGGNKADEVECQIVYQADGSAYILESQSQLPCSVVLSSSRPSVISLCHFSSPRNSNLQSFHVFHPKNWCHLTRDIIALLTCQSKDSAPARSGLSELPLPGKEQPILVCFSCCLSFKHIHAFRLHISQHHTIPVTTEEQQLLTLPHTCAILHPVGLSDHLVLSFLEPKTSIVQTAPSQVPTTKPGCKMASMLSQEGRENFQMSEPGFSLQPSPPRAPLPTSVLSPAKDHSTLGREGPQLSIDGDLGEEGRSSEEGEESSSSLVVSTVEDGTSSISSSGRQGHMNEPPLSNQSNPKSPDSVTVATSFTNNTKSPTDSELECGRSFNCHGPAPVSSTVQTSPTATIPKELANQESVMETEPNMLSEKGSAMAKQPNGKLCDNKPATSYSDLPSNHSSSRSPGIPQQINKSTPEDGQVDVGRGSLLTGSDHDFVTGRDSNQGSSYSYGAQLPMTHSRNSCKTLKCPKCNWHYKYQQTLEAHMKEKHPDSDDGQCPYCASGQDHPRLARGETYTCGYKPFRCHVCQYSTTTKGNLSIHMQSDKHLNNMQNLQAQTRSDAPPTQPNHLPHPHSTQTASPSPSKPQGRASWRCEVCDYETNVARNLRIHMTSEKHTHNMLLLQQNLAHMQRQHRQNAHDIYQYSQSQSRLPNSTVIQSAGEALQDKLVEEDSPEALFECALCGHFSSDSLGSLSQHLAAQRSLPDADWRSTTGDAHLCRLCHYVTPLRANFQLHCQTDKHLQRYQLAAHLQEASKHHRNPEEEEEWLLRCVAAGVQVQLRCNACSYEANSLEKLKLHTLNIRHKASVKLYKYLQQFEGAVSDGGELHCVLCDYSTQNSLSLVQHSNLLSHQRVEGLVRLQRIQSGLQDEEEELSAIFKIRKNHAQDSGDVTEMESSTEITSDQEDQTKHTDKDEEKTETAIHREKRQNESSIVPKRPRSASEDLEDAIPSKLPRAQEEISSEQVRQCPFCRFSHTELGRLRNHVMIQHAVQPTLRCPLCQETLRSVALMRTHLTQLHSVTADCTQKLINAVIASDVLPEKMFLPVQDSNTQQTKADSSCNGTKRPDEQSDDEQEKVTTCQTEIAKTPKQPLEDAESTKENTAAFPCWQKGCNKILTSSAALQQHFNHYHSQKPQMPISDRHVYKYRCNQCSLAFKTAEKLQLHSQYHAIRAATMCCLCQRSFRTVQALQKHLETSHLELSEIQLQQLCGSLLLTEDLLGSVDQGLDDEQGSPEEEKEKEVQEIDQEEKVSPPDSGLSLAQEDVELNLKPTVPPLRKSSNPSTEKFLDPSRPFKCTVCKESFTQKNILLVHYNSVSHLHKVKRSVQDSSTALPESVSSSTDHKPFKCCICNVAYSQSSTLEIHMRSVLHQTKARAAKHESSTNVNSLLRKAVPDNALASSTTALKPSNDTNSASSTSSSIDQPYLKNQQSTELSVVSSSQIGHSSHTEESKKKQMLDTMALTTTAHQHKLFQQQQLQQQQFAQAQAQIQQELQKKAAILQSHLFNPALLHHFPITADALLPLQQQQQMLLPFLLPGGEFQISPELNLKGSGINLNTTKLIAPENCSEASQQGSSSSSYTQPSKGDGAHISHQSVSPASEEKSSIPQKADEKMLTSDPKRVKGNDGKKYCKETGKMPKTISKDSSQTFKEPDDVEEEVSDSGKMFTELIPPRVAHDAPGNVSKALLENIGFELVVHFNENKQQYEKDQADVAPHEESKTNTEEIHTLETSGKLECESCGKLFSNALILKSHKEHIHQSIFPIQSLEKFAKDYREQYDKLFPFKPETSAASPLLAIPASPPPPLDEQTQQKPMPCISTSTATVTSPTVSTSQVPLAPLPLTLDLPLFPPLMMHPMPLQTLPPQLSVHLPPVEASLTPDLAQLYHQQLTPSLMQQQGKRPRTRITDDQLRILRQYFDINNSPNDDQIQEMANKSGLPNKVIKHWFRNTLFKERQRNKDSPYNFNNPPITTLEEFKVDSRPSSPEPPKQEFSGGKRSSRTRFTDYQLRVLQDFFDANAYPKDDEFEELSNLLNLPTRVIVVWFQNARQKAKKNYENQADGGKDTEHREISNDHYICTPNGTYECKKCSMMFQRIFDLLSHQKKVCYKDEDEEDCRSQNELLMDAKSSSSPNLTNFSFSNDTHIDVNIEETSNIKEELDHDTLTEDRRQMTETSHNPPDDESGQVKGSKDSNEIKQHTSTKTSSLSPLHQSQQANPSIPQTSQAEPKSPQISPSSQQQHPSSSQQITPYHCIQCKLSFPSFEHWQEHQQMHFFVAQNHFVHSQFLDRPMDIPLMLFDSGNPLVARQVLSGAFPQIPVNSPTIAVPDSTINSLKRKLELKSDTNSVENDWENNNDDSQRDKRMRTTITPEQLEILYQKYLLDSNPTRQMLDNISQEVGLKKRVVQVWFQNTRARERKGQFRAMGPIQAHRRCPFCRALFKAQTALDAHIRSRHWHEAKNAGYSMEVSGMTHDLEGSQMKMDLLNISNCSQLANSEESLNGADSPSCKNVDVLSNQQHSSPRTLKSDGMDNVEGSGPFDYSRQDNLKDILLGTFPIGATTNDENDFEEKHNSTDHSASSSNREASLENDDKMSQGLVSPAMSFNTKEYDNDLILDYSENSSLADPASPCPGGSNSQNIDADRLGQKRYRTQLSNLQVKVLKACFSDYKTPTMLECEALGNDIGLPKRVVQVWFQNARAKEKKAKLSLAKQFGTESTCTDRPKTECTLCCVKYSTCLSVRDHVFSQQHLEKVKEALGGQLDKEREYVDVHPLMSQEEMDHLNKESEPLAVSKTRPAESSEAGSKSVTNLSSTKSDSSDVSSNGLIIRPSTSSSLSTSTDKSSASTTNTVLTPKHTLSDPKLQFSKESHCEKNSGSAKSATDSNTCTNKEKTDFMGPATPTLKTGKAYSMEAAQLQALQAAGVTDPSSLLSNSLLPCLMPGFPQIFPPQIPTALTGSFLQPMFGMEGMFQYGSVVPQALMGLSPSSVLQQYQHNLQGALMHHRLQLQQKQLLQQQPPKSKVSQISASPYSQDMALNKGLVLNLSKSEEKQGTTDGSSSSFLSSTKPMNNSFLVGQCIVSKGMCKERGKDICLYDCLVCEISLMGNEELIQHLENPQHKQRAAEHLNAKEHASRLLPHVSSSSTSQPNPPSKQMSPSIFQPNKSAQESPSDNPCISKTTDCS